MFHVCAFNLHSISPFLHTVKISPNTLSAKQRIRVQNLQHLFWIYLSAE